MAKTAFRHNIQTGQPYAVPAGKYAVFSAVNVGGSSSLTIAGVTVAALGPPNGGLAPTTVAGLTANAGEVVARASGGGGGENVGIFGFLYDV